MFTLSLWQRLQLRGQALNEGLLRLVDRLTPSEQSRIYALTVAIGVVCGFVAVAFHLAIHGATDLLSARALDTAQPIYALVIWGILTPALGGLVVGVIVHRFAPDARGSGIPQVKAVYALRSGRLRLRDAFAKLSLTSLQIGSGASLGREGPTVQICASVASGMGRLLALSPSNQRRLIPVGAAAGIAAAFNAPIAAVTFVIEELVGALDTTVLSGVVVAAALAAVVEHGILGEIPLFDVRHAYGMEDATSLVLYAALGLAAGALGTAFSKGLLGLRARMQRQTRVPPWLTPALGGLVTGVLAVVVLIAVDTTGVAGGGYETLRASLHGEVALLLLAVLCLAKFVATIFSYSTGGVGGIFAPSLFIGAMLGGVVGHADQLVFGHSHDSVGAFALVGMGAFFAAVIRAPLTSILIIFEMTGNYRLVLPLMVANTVAFVFARRWQRTPLYEALLEQDGIRLPHRVGATSDLRALPVSKAMTTEVVTLGATETIAEALARIGALPHASFPVVHVQGRLLGVMTLARLRRLSAEGRGQDFVGSHARVREYLVSDAPLGDALTAMNRLGVRQMAVVDHAEHGLLVGIVSMSDVMRALLSAERGEPVAAVRVRQTETNIPIQEQPVDRPAIDQ